MGYVIRFVIYLWRVFIGHETEDRKQNRLDTKLVAGEWRNMYNELQEELTAARERITSLESSRISLESSRNELRGELRECLQKHKDQEVQMKLLKSQMRALEHKQETKQRRPR